MLRSVQKKSVVKMVELNMRQTKTDAFKDLPIYLNLN